jgi:hypothetical protein
VRRIVEMRLETTALLQITITLSTPAVAFGRQRITSLCDLVAFAAQSIPLCAHLVSFRAQAVTFAAHAVVFTTEIRECSLQLLALGTDRVTLCRKLLIFGCELQVRGLRHA